jgi:flavin reductase (DIM6/NTAB) family NADH-FMN oxidoreductase RutF
MAGPETLVGEDKHVYVPAEGHGLRHEPFNAIVGPRPIGWVSTVDAAGAVNLAPYSFFNGFNYTPPIVGFSSTGWKDSVANAEATGAFVWNLVTRPLAEQMNATSAPAPHEVNEFQLGGLTMAPSLKVAPPRVLESPVNFECRVTQIVRLKSAEGREVDAWVTFGEVVAAHIDRSLIKDGVYDTAAAHPVLRAGGPTGYIEVTPEAFFHMRRPGWP